MGFFSTLKNLSPSGYRVRVVTTTVLLLAVPLFVYYVIYVRNQNAYFTQRAFRSLSLTSEQIALKVESAGTVLKNGSEKVVNPVPAASPEANSTPTPAVELKNFEDVFKNLKDDSPVITPISFQIKAADQPTQDLITIEAVREDEGVVWLYVNYESKPTRNKQVFVVKARTNLHDLLQPLMHRDSVGDVAEDQFQDLLIAEATTGSVFFQLDPSEVRVASLDKLSTQDPQKKIEVKEISETSNVAEVTLAGTSFKLFSNPIELSLQPTGSKDGRNTSWILGGLVRATSFRDEVWSVPYNYLILCAFATALILLNWPFIKLVLIGPKDRLKTGDVYFLTFSTVVGLAVVTTFGLYWYSDWKLNDVLDGQLVKLEDQIKKNLDTELDNAISQLNLLSHDCYQLGAVGSSIKCEQPQPSNDLYKASGTDKNNILPDVLKESSHPYPYFDTAVWLNKEGLQKAKWTIRGSTTQLIDVSTRSYFRNLRLGDFQKLSSGAFALEPIISKTTGRNEVEISVLSADPDWITAFDTRLISLMQPVLPAGFGYLVIDKNGKVLFHSDEAHHLGENIFRECDDESKLRSAVVSKNSPPLVARYLGQDHSLLVRSVRGFPDWSLVVFRNKQTLRSAFLELLSLVSLLFFVYALLLMAGFTFFYLVNFRNERRTWLWPSRKKTEVYYQSLLLMIGLTVVSLPLAILLHGQWLVITSVLISFVAILIFFLHLYRSHKGLFARFFQKLLTRTKWFWRYDVAYTLNLATLLLVVAILPAGAFFKFAYESEIMLFIKHGQFTLASSLAERNKRVRSEYSQIAGATEPVTPTNLQQTSKDENSIPTSDFVKQRLGLEWDIYSDFFFNTQRQPKPGDPSKCSEGSSAEKLVELTRFLPLSNQTSVERRGLLMTSSTEGTCRWESSASGDLILHLDGAAARDLSWGHLATRIPPLGIPGIPWVILLFAALIPFFAWMHFIVRKVFLLDIHRPMSFPLKSILQQEFDRNLFVVLDAPFTEKTTIKNERVLTIDLPSIATSNSWSTAIDGHKPETVDAIAVDHFEYKLNDPATNKNKLGLLEDLLNLERPIIVFSDAEPSLYQFGDDDEGHDFAGRWAGLTSKFFKEYAEDLGDSNAFAAALKKEKERLLKSDLKGRPVEEIEELFKILIAECDHKLPLQNIGLQILRQNFASLSTEHLLNRIVSQAQTYYTDIWKSCSTDERLTLFHLAQDRLLSHRDTDIVPLLRRGLIVRDDDVHLMNDSFRMFVKSPEQATACAQHEETVKRGSLWNTLKAPLMVILAGVAIFLFVTQRDIYTSSLAVLTAVTTIIPGLFKLLGMFQDEPASRPSGQP